MLIIDNHNCIKLTRGDTACLDVELKNDDELYIMSDGDKLKFTAKEKIGATESVISLESSTNQIHISPEDTKLLKYKNYVYEIELITASGEIYTVVPNSMLKICEEVG